MNMYFSAILTPDDLSRKILRWKHFMKDRYGCQAALKSPPHITITPPFWLEEDEETGLISALAEYCSDQAPVEITAKDFSSFPPKVIFIDILHNPELESLYQKFNAFLITEKSMPVKLNDHPFMPHITIASRDLYKQAFFEARDYFSRKKFESSWQATSLTLLRHNKKKWDVLSTSPFQKA